MLGLIAAMALVFVVLRWALAGHVIAVGVSAAIIALALAGLVHASLFALVWVVSLLRRGRTTTSPSSLPKGAD